MSAKTVTIDHPHAEVIAAYYSGKTVQLDVHEDGNWDDWSCKEPPHFEHTDKWRIKPEPLVRWVEFDSDDSPTGDFWSSNPGRIAQRSGYRVVRMVEQPE